MVGCEDPGAVRVARRLQVLAGYPWSSWRVYSGAEPKPVWLRPEGLGSGHGDWGWDGLHYVATRQGGYRLTELRTQIEGLKY